MRCVGEDGKKGVAMHASPNLTGVGEAGVPCYIHYHNTSFYGLARSDYKMAGITAKKDWKISTPAAKEEHYRKIRRVLEPTYGNKRPAESVNGGYDDESSGYASDYVGMVGANRARI